MSIISLSTCPQFTAKREIALRNFSRSKNSSIRLCMGSGNGGFGQNPKVGDRDGVIIVDHGSRRKESNLMLSKRNQSSSASEIALRNFSRSKNSSIRLCMGSGNGGFGQNPKVGDRDGVIIVDHGSRLKESNLMLNEFVSMFKERTGYPIVEPAHMELAEPSIHVAFNSCVLQGANRVIVSPFFLLPGRHWNQDIPSLTAEAAKEHPGVSYLVTAPLGLHPLLVDVLNDRINHCLSHIAGDVEECSVCVGTNKCQLH